MTEQLKQQFERIIIDNVKTTNPRNSELSGVEDAALHCAALCIQVAVEYEAAKVQRLLTNIKDEYSKLLHHNPDVLVRIFDEYYFNKTMQANETI